jgi:Bacterial archaeo-eukaryotic release factor family 2
VRFPARDARVPDDREPSIVERNIAVDVLAPATRLVQVYEHSGPFATVYLDATRATESGAHEVAVRWRDVRTGLAEQGVAEATLAALDEAVGADTGIPGRHGLVAVAADGQVCLRDTLAEPPAQSAGTVGALPHLLPYLAQRTTEVPHVVVVADRTGADILAVSENGGQREQTVDGGSSYPLHRTAADQWNERHFQHRVENNWAANAQNVAAAVHEILARATAKLVVVAGDVRARALIADALGTPPGVHVRVIEEGGRGAGSSDEALQRAVHGEVLREVWRERREVLEHLQQNLGRQEYATAGVEPVVDALRMAQVDTLVISDDPSSPLRAWVGPGLTDFGVRDEEAAALGMSSVDHDRLDAALVRAAVGTGAKLVVTPGAHGYLPEGIGALLRFDTPA